MRKICRSAKFWAHRLLLHSLQSAEDPLSGGQAVMEGVMMRTPQSYCVAVRRSSGEIVTKEESAKRLAQRSRFWRLPIVRGCGVIGQSMALGMRALNFSAEQAADAEDADESKQTAEVPGWVLWLNIAVSVGFFVVMYKFLPLVATRQLQDRFPAPSTRWCSTTNRARTSAWRTPSDSGHGTRVAGRAS